jgi:hypothetical protein
VVSAIGTADDTDAAGRLESRGTDAVGVEGPTVVVGSSDDGDEGGDGGDDDLGDLGEPGESTPVSSPVSLPLSPSISASAAWGMRIRSFPAATRLRLVLETGNLDT